MPYTALSTYLSKKVKNTTILFLLPKKYRSVMSASVPNVTKNSKFKGISNCTFSYYVVKDAV